MQRVIAIAAGLATFALGGCGGEPDQADPGDGRGDGAAGADDRRGDGEDASPLAELFGWHTDPVEQRRQELEIQELAARCMREHGWEYTPVDYGVQQAPVVDGVDTSDPQAYGEKYGYGVMYNYEVSSGPAAAAIDRAEPDRFVDPNEQYVASLSEAEQQSYHEDLYGPVLQSPDIAEDEVYVSPSLLDQGCVGQARYEIVGEDPASDPDVAALLDEYYSNQNDAETDQLVRAWAECLEPTLAEYGIEETPTDMYAGSRLVEIEKYLALGAEQRPFTDGDDLEAIRASGATLFSAYQVGSAPGIAYVAPPGDVPVLPGPEIDQLSAMERDIWRADQACQDEVGWLQFQRDRERAVVEQIRAVLPDQ